MFRRRRNHTTFHVTDVENLYAALRDGQQGTAFRHAVRILDRGLNGPPAGLSRGFTAEFPMASGDQERFAKLADDLESLVGGDQIRRGADHLKANPTVGVTKSGPSRVQEGAEKVTTAEKPHGTHKAKEDTKKTQGKVVSAKAAEKHEEGGEVEVPKEFSKPDHRAAGDDAEGGVVHGTAEVETPLASTESPVGANEQFDPVIGAVPWALIAQLVYQVIQLIREWNTPTT